MSEAADLPTRVTRLEERTAEVHHLASRADHEASDVHVRLRAHTKSLEALRETQVEQGREMREGFKQVDDRVKGIEDRFERLEAKVDNGFTMVTLGLSQITALLTIAGEDSGET